jgi:hypothetical protein
MCRANATPAGMLSIENFIEWYRVTCDLWESMRENLKEGKKPPPNFQLVWDDSMLTAKVTFDTYDDGSLVHMPFPVHPVSVHKSIANETLTDFFSAMNLTRLCGQVMKG